jgi:CDP-diacylglycerol--glycerol-3-phosphate 3-phosphatidyltransferase
LALGLLIWPLPHGDAHGGAFDFWPGILGEALFYLAQVMLAAAFAMTMWSGYEFFRDVRRQRASRV